MGYVKKKLLLQLIKKWDTFPHTQFSAKKIQNIFANPKL